MKVALIASPSLFLLEPYTFPPLSVMYLSAVAKKCGYEVDVIDLTGDEDYLQTVKQLPKYDLIGISATTPQFHYAVEVLNILRKSQPKATVVIGGAHASVEPNSCIRLGLDAAIVGEAEIEWPLLLSRFENGWRPKGEVVYAQLPKNLDSLPFPDRDCIKLHQYQYIIEGLRATSIITSRGCYWNCAFCSHWPKYNCVRFRSPQNVAEEIEYVKKKYGYHAFMIWDDEINQSKKRVLELCSALEPLNIKWRAFIRAKPFDYEMAEAMRKAGCVEVGVGCESGDNRILKIINKGTRVEDNTRARRICKEVGIRFKAFTIIGLPSESRETVQATMNWLIENEPDDFDVTIFTPYPGSPIWEHPEKYDIIFDKAEIVQNLYANTFYKGPHSSLVATSKLSSEELISLRDEIEDKCGRKIKSRWLWEKKVKM